MDYNIDQERIGNMTKIDISPSELYDLYVSQGKTISEIAALRNCSETTVRRRLTQFGIPTRSRGIQPMQTVSTSWSPRLAYAVGLITADGNLSPDGRHITFVSVDRELHDTYKQCLGISNHTGTHGSAFHTTFGDVNFYQWLQNIGVMPNKTFKLAQVQVPDEYLADFVRGYLDGDGNINVYLDRYNAHRFGNEAYVYWRLSVRFHSASTMFLLWLQRTLTRLVQTRGTVLPAKRAWVLKYGKIDSLHLLSWIYYAKDLPSLARKRARFESYLSRINLTDSTS